MNDAEIVKRAMSILGKKGGSAFKPDPALMRERARQSWSPEARAKRLANHAKKVYSNPK